MARRDELERRRLEKKRRPMSNEEVKQLEKIVDRLETMTTQSRMKDLAYHYTNPKEVIKTNIIAGVARGLGMTVGTAMIIALLLFLLSQFVTLPIIGEYIGNLLDVIEQERN
ncbi:DUF5665 domain-containing protein [Aliibacillus thermotolerans]|uniref:DUF5665 domain-containing protein n=1 Tax=Aliibacillus thermotolerans TaxID=1834418 RepID=A0ABW0U669_9BACI|nr:DUF5665 domain-containing protein [Aliibacillus thermotolerans]MDA3129230.1 hypothetical protein [Aliibacillus thermotolerans]